MPYNIYPEICRILNVNSGRLLRFNKYHSGSKNIRKFIANVYTDIFYIIVLQTSIVNKLKRMSR